MSARKVKNKRDVKKTRKQLRKEERKSKKIRRNEYYTNRRQPGQFVRVRPTEEAPEARKVVEKSKTQRFDVKNRKETKEGNMVLTVEDVRNKEKKQQMKLQKEMKKQRNKQLVEANLEEDHTIKHLEKQLKLNKRKSKSVPASFSLDGLDYLLEVCDSDTMKTSAQAEQQLAEVNDEFEEDLVLMTQSNDNSAKTKKRTSKEDKPAQKKFKADVEISDFEEDESDFGDLLSDGDSDKDDVSDLPVDDSDVDDDNSDEADDSDVSGTRDDTLEDDDLDISAGEKESQEKRDGTWEDIYGRLRAEDGSILTTNNQKYIPPAARKVEGKEINEKLNRLRKQLKGLLNRLAESNMHNITKQIEELYMNNSRHDMNHTITNLITEGLISNIISPERLLMEHVLLITILHANVGTEVGAHFLQTVIKQFDDLAKSSDVEDKKLDNVVIIVAQLYNFKLFDSKLVYELLNKLAERFQEKDVECILHVLRNVGFSLRKDDPIALKNLILSLQKRASNASDDLKNNSRVKFMLDVLLAIKNNNVTKIPNYDTSYSEHLKKIMKGFIRKGNYVTQLNISLDDLLKADVKGKWWVVGSAWSGNTTDTTPDSAKEKPNTFSQKLLELASKQRMNTDTRKNIFCVIMSAEDYLDAFEKLLHLGLKNQQEREIIHVILHCCLHEKAYNPYYATLAQKFCEHDRKYQMTIKYSIWDKLKALTEQSATHISNLAKLLAHLFLEKGLPISTLKVVQFSELDKVTLRFIRQILLAILLHEDLDVCTAVFDKVAISDRLKMFRESLRLFLHHFLLRNLRGIDDEKTQLLKQRVKVVDKLLSGKQR